MSVGEENHIEHDRKADDVLGASTERLAQLIHCFVEANVLEELDPAEESEHRHGVVEHVLPVDERVKVSVRVRARDQRIDEIVHRDHAVDVETDAGVRQQNDDHVENVENFFEVVQTMN